MENRIDNKLNKNKIWLIISILGIIILVFGITFSIFRYGRTSNNSSLVLGDIYMSSKENNIVLNKLEPMSPSEGINKGSKYNFSVEGYNTSNKNIYYGIYLNRGSEETGKTRFKDEDMMMYLTETKNGETKAVYGPGSVKEFNDKMIYASTIDANIKKDEKIEINYELTVWLSDNILISDTEESYEGRNIYTTNEYENGYASIDVKVYGDFEEKNIKKASENITATTISTNKNYEIKDDIKDAIKTSEDVKVVITTDKEAKLYLTNLETGLKEEKTLTLKNNLYTFEKVETEKSRYSYYFEYSDSTISQIYYYNINILKVEFISKPTNALCSNKVYNGSEQLITTIENNDSYSISNNRQINAGEYQIVAKLKEGFMWDDETSTDVSFTCQIDKAPVTLTLSETNATINYTDTKTFTIKSSQAGSISIKNGNTSVVSVENNNINLEANKEQDINLSAITKGESTLTIKFTPSNNNYETKSVTYDLIIEILKCATFNKNGAKLVNDQTTDELNLCCKVTSGSSCSIQAPSIVADDSYEVLGWGDSIDATTAVYNQLAVINLEKDDNEYFAITKSLDSSRQIKKIKFNKNGADSFTYLGTTYTNDTEITCKTDYGYNGETLPDSCKITLPTIARSGGTTYGWSEDSEATTATYNVGEQLEVFENITLNAITSKKVTLTLNANGGTTTVGTVSGQIYNNNAGASVRIPSYDNQNMCRDQNSAYISYKYLGLTDEASNKTVKYCQGDMYFLTKDETLYSVWNETYAVTSVSGNNKLYLRSDCGTNYSEKLTMNNSQPVYITAFGKALSYDWYWVKYGSNSGCASSMYLNSITYPKANSCNYTDYVCNGATAADLTLSPGTINLNLKKDDMLSKTIDIDSRCGNITSVTVDDSSLISATRNGNVITVTASSNSVNENQIKETNVHVAAEWGCTASTKVIVKNTNATPPVVNISFSGDSSTCSGSYLKGSTAKITCQSSLVPINEFMGTTSSDNSYTKETEISLTSTGTNTIKATCSNSEGTTTVSQAVSVKVRNASSACGCSSYKYNCSCTCGKRYNGSCTSVKSTTTATSSGACASACKSRCTSLYGSTSTSYCGATGSYTGRTCKSYNTCCHT